MRRTRGAVLAMACFAAGALVACSDDSGSGSGSGDTTDISGQTDVAVTQSSMEMSAAVPPVPGSPTAGDVPLVAEIDAAIAAIEAQLGGPQAYFEINATPKLVNLFVALNNGAVVQPWVFLDGELSSVEGQPAGGGTFVADDLTFDPSSVLAGVLGEVPDAVIDSFVINGDGEGNVQYEVLVTSARGGALSVIVGPDGDVLSVDTIT